MFKYYLIRDFSHFLLGLGSCDLYGSPPHVFIDVYKEEDHMVGLDPCNKEIIYSLSFM